MSIFANQVFVAASASEDCKYSVLNFNEANPDNSIDHLVRLVVPTVVAIAMAKIILEQNGIEIKEMTRQ